MPWGRVAGSRRSSSLIWWAWVAASLSALRVSRVTLRRRAAASASTFTKRWYSLVSLTRLRTIRWGMYLLGARVRRRETWPAKHSAKAAGGVALAAMTLRRRTLAVVGA